MINPISKTSELFSVLSDEANLTTFDWDRASVSKLKVLKAKVFTALHIYTFSIGDTLVHRKSADAKNDGEDHEHCEQDTHDHCIVFIVFFEPRLVVSFQVDYVVVVHRVGHTPVTRQVESNGCVGFLLTCIRVDDILRVCALLSQVQVQMLP